ncbi:hypothetical protein [Thalassobaculum salexigens]|uniref:hypothetical protein n=1 Tax=Thalassobaculum salexigens TaxID=455360 RepID=UPI00042520C9|nr:hypothetical protein [Thalassobaculum salexigens]
MATTVERVTKIDRIGDFAEVELETDAESSLTVRIPMSKLWEIASDLRQASIHLLAPVPLYNPSAWKSAVARKDDVAPDDQPKEDVPETVKTGFEAVEEAWELCDRLNQPDQKSLDKLVRLNSLSAADRAQLEAPDNSGALLSEKGYVKLKTGLVIRYREETRDWIPDRLPADEEE